MSDAEHGRHPVITVSMTSYPARIQYAHRVVENMLAQTMKPDRIVLWLADEQFPKREEELPYKLLRLRDEGLEIRWCEDIKSYKKLIPSLSAFPDDIIITVDDDLVYDDDLIETLMDSYGSFPEAVSTVRTHLMRFEPDGTLCDYAKWRMDYQNSIGKPGMCLFATTGAGTLFPPGVFGPEMLDPALFMELCPKADDVWVKVMQLWYRVPTVLARRIRPLRYIPDTQTATLFDYNLRRGGNDVQLRAALDYYNKKLETERLEQRLLLDSPGFCPEFAVIVPESTDDARFSACMDSIKAQTRYGVHTICVCATEDEKRRAAAYMSSDGRTSIIEVEPGTALTGRIAAGMQFSGDGADYFMVLSERDRLAPEALKKIYDQLVRTPCKLLAMTGALTGAGSVDGMTTVLSAADGEFVSVEADGPVGSDLHTKVFHSTLRKTASPLIAGARLGGEDARQFAARVLMILSKDSAAAFPAYGMITHELYVDKTPVDAEYIIEMNRAGGQLAVQSPRCRPWLVSMHDSIFSGIERAVDKSEYYGKLCEIFGEPVTISETLELFGGREGLILEAARGSHNRRAVPSAAPQMLVIIDLEGSDRIGEMLEACMNTVSAVLLISADRSAAQYAGGRVSVELLSYNEKNDIRSLLERVDPLLRHAEPDAVQLIGSVTPAMTAVLMLSEVTAHPSMLCLVPGKENAVPLWELAEHVTVTVTGSEEDAALLRLLDRRTAACVPPADLAGLKLEEMTDSELSTLGEKILPDTSEQRVAQWREAYSMLEYMPPAAAKEQPLRRAVKSITAMFTERSRRDGGLIHSLDKGVAQAYRSAQAMRENLEAGAADAAARTAEKEQRLQKNSADALDRQKRFTEGKITALEKRVEDRDGWIGALKDEKKSLSAELGKAKRAEKHAWEEYENLRNSKIFLAGRIVTWLPRKAIALAKKLAERVRGGGE